MKRVVVTLVAGTALLVSANAAFACTAEEASEKFSKRTEQLSSPGSVPAEKIGEVWTRMNEAGTALGNGDYDLACQIYDQIAADYGLDK